jgi:hypothetical protein
MCCLVALAACILQNISHPHQNRPSNPLVYFTRAHHDRILYSHGRRAGRWTDSGADGWARARARAWARAGTRRVGVEWVDRILHRDGHSSSNILVRGAPALCGAQQHARPPVTACHKDASSLLQHRQAKYSTWLPRLWQQAAYEISGGCITHQNVVANAAIRGVCCSATCLQHHIVPAQECMCCCSKADSQRDQAAYSKA